MAGEGCISEMRTIQKPQQLLLKELLRLLYCKSYWVPTQVLPYPLRTYNPAVIQ